MSITLRILSQKNNIWTANPPLISPQGTIKQRVKSKINPILKRSSRDDSIFFIIINSLFNHRIFKIYNLTMS